MYSALYNSARALCAAMAFGMVFFLTPRAMVQSADAPRTNQVPVDTLDESESCLWCSPVPEVEDCQSDDQRVWLNPDAPRSEPCPTSTDSPKTGPNA